MKGHTMSYIQSFKRKETKYLLTSQQAEAFISSVGGLLIPDKYGEYTICNLYLDTADYYFIEHSLDRPAYKEKLRVRSYGTASDESTVFFEIKKKYRGVVYKRRITLPFNQAENYMLSGEKPSCLEGYSANQIFSEIDYLMQKHKPFPRLYLAYDRKAFTVANHPSLRITFDSNIRSRSGNLTLKSDENTSLLNTGIPDYKLMEIKSDGAIPIEISAVLSRLKIYPVSFSKYGRIYQHLRQKNQNTGKEIYI